MRDRCAWPLQLGKIMRSTGAELAGENVVVNKTTEDKTETKTRLIISGPYQLSLCFILGHSVTGSQSARIAYDVFRRPREWILVSSASNAFISPFALALFQRRSPDGETSFTSSPLSLAVARRR